MLKNRVGPSSTSSSPKQVKDLSSDPFFASGNTEKPQKRQPFGKDKFFTNNNNQNRKKFDGKKNYDGKTHFDGRKFEGKKNYEGKNKFNSELNPRSKNISKAKEFGGKKFNQNFKNKIEKFNSLEEDADYKLQAKNKCRDIVKFKGVKEEKKPFDKKKWRLQKYSKKYKLEQWEEKRKKAVLREYYQQTKDDNPKTDVQKIYEEYGESDNERNEDKPIHFESKSRNIEPKSRNIEPKPRKNYVHHPDFVPSQDENEQNEIVDNGKKKKSTKRKVQEELERLKQEKVDKKEEILNKKKDKEEALKMYKQKKIEKHKKLNKKTKRGQPVMKGRIEMLLERIQNG